MKIARRFLALSPAGRAEWVAVAREILRARLAVWLCPTSRLLRPRGNPLPPGPDEGLARLARQVERVAARIPFCSCLVQALAFQRLAGARGWASELRIGVRGAGSEFSAHAWVEAGGRVILGGHRGPHQVILVIS